VKNRKLVKFLDTKVTSRSRRHKDRVEAAFCEFLLKTEIDTHVTRNIFLGFPTPGLSHAVKNHITAFLSSDSSEVTELEIDVTRDFINKKIVDKFKSQLKYPLSILNSIELSPLDKIYKIIGHSAVQFSYALNENRGKYLPSNITLEARQDNQNGKAFVIVKTPLGIEELKKSLVSFSFGNCRKKCELDTDLEILERKI
jgi:hypothetical protein